MKKKVLFKVGDKVRVTRDGYNASSIAPNVNVPWKGVYTRDDWAKCTFTISGKYEPITFEHDPKCYGAYPLMWKGKLRGYVYNTALKLVKSI